MQFYFAESRKPKKNLWKNPTDCMALLHFHTYYQFSCKESIVYSQALWYNMIISKDHILEEEVNNLTRVVVVHAYPLNFVINNIKNPYLPPQ